MEKDNLKKKIIMVIALGIVVLALGVGGVYAYFAATVTQDTTSNVSISAVSGLAISFSNSANLNIDNALPGQSWTKTFSATLTNNTSEIPIVYSVKLHITNNTFQSGEEYLTYTLTGAENKTETQIKEQSGDIVIVENKTIKGNKNTNEVVHSYTLTISYPNNPNSIQTQGGVFNGYVYFETGTNQISGNVVLSNYDSTEIKSKYELQIGDLVTIGTEQFYVIPYGDGSIIKNDKIHALAKYNLLVGRTYTRSSDYTEISTTTEGYGLQNKNAIGSNSKYPYIGTTAFSNSSNCIYSGSVVEGIINTYVNEKLKPIAGNDITGELITSSELKKLGCSFGSDFSCLQSPYEWVYSTSYWTGSTNQGDRVYRVYSSGGLENYLCTVSNNFGVRPVIVF